MESVKLLFTVASLCFLALALLLVWTEPKTVCSLFMCKILETIFIISSVLLVKAKCSIN